jgi:hypothetical protein
MIVCSTKGMPHVKVKFILCQSDKCLHNLKAAARAVKLSVVVKRGMYGGIYSNYRIMEAVAQCRPEVYEVASSLPETHTHTHTHTHTYTG